MKPTKAYRFEQNPVEEKLVKEFIKEFTEFNRIDILEDLVLTDEIKLEPNGENPHFLTEREQNIILNIVQWMGSHVGQCFLEECGYITPQRKND